MNRPWLNDVKATLAEHGFRKRAGAIFTTEVTGGVLGRVGLNQATKGHAAGAASVYPIIGVRHQAVERLVAELRGEKFHEYTPSTISTPLAYVMPEHTARAATWVLTDDNTGDDPDDMVAKIVEHGLGFMRANADLASLRQRMDERMGHDHLLPYRRPVAAWLAGDPDTARALIDKEEADLDNRIDLAADELRAFADAFRTYITTHIPA